MAEVAQQEWDWLVPTNKNLLRPDEAATYFGRSVDYVYDIIEEGKLEVHAPTDRLVERKTITRRSVVLHLAETAKYNPAYFAERVEALLAHLDSHQLSRLIAAATTLRAKRITTL